MAEILFVTWDGGGNVPPAVGIAAELKARGHTIRFVGHAGQAPTLIAAGFEVARTEDARQFSALEDHSPLAVVAAFADRGLGRDVLNALNAHPADMVVVDCLLFGVMDQLHRAGQPYILLEHCYDAYYRSFAKGPVGLGMRIARLHPDRLIGAAQHRLVATLPSLDPAGRTATPDLTYVGPVVAVSPRLDTEPTVLVSLSAIRFPRMSQCLQTILDACAGLDARVIVTTGPVVDPAELRPPANTEVHRYVPHTELMPQASLLVGHGGHGTTMQALAHDLPTVLMPMQSTLDQPMVAQTVEAAGAGRTVNKKATADQLSPIIASLLADGPHRAAAARLGAEIRSTPGAPRAADLIEQLIGPARSSRQTSDETRNKAQ